MTDNAEQRRYAANTISGLVREYERNLLALAAANRDSEPNAQTSRAREIRGLELSNKWIIADAIASECSDIGQIRAKLELWRLRVLGAHGDRPRTPEEELIASALEDLARLEFTS